MDAMSNQLTTTIKRFSLKTVGIKRHALARKVDDCFWDSIVYSHHGGYTLYGPYGIIGKVSREDGRLIMKSGSIPLGTSIHELH